jgi:hypothetical protein
VGNYYRGDEIPVNVEMLVGGVPVLNQELGLRIHGAGSRTHDKKSFRLYSTGENASAEQYRLPNLSVPCLSTRLNGFYSETPEMTTSEILFKDAYIHQIGKGLNMELQDYRPPVTYLNGEYWGIHNARERLDEYYYASHYALEPDNIEFFADPDISGDTGHYADLSGYIKTHNMADGTNYNYALARMDVWITSSIIVCWNYMRPTGTGPMEILTYWRHKVPYNPCRRCRQGRTVEMGAV